MKKITFIYPKWEGKALFGTSILKFPPLSLIHLASLTPTEWDIEIIDENRQKIDFKDTDLVAISSATCGAPRAYEIADKYREKGIPVIMGGVHASMVPEEAGRHADSVVIGEPDCLWEKILEDFKNKKLKQIYEIKECPDILRLKPKRKLSKKIDYPFLYLLNAAGVQTGRGCPFECDFCSVPKLSGKRIRHRDIEDVAEEISFSLSKAKMGKKYVIFMDDNIAADKSYALNLFEKIKPMGISWSAQADIRIALDEELLNAATESGMKEVTIGFETIDEKSLEDEVCKSKASWRKNYEKAILKLHEKGILITGCFVFGFDNHDKNIFKETVDWAKQNNLDVCDFTLATPFPGTAFFEKLEKQNRIFAKKGDGSYNWEKFDTVGGMVFTPARMNVSECEKGLEWAYKEFYSLPSILSRMKNTGKKRRLREILTFLLINLELKFFHPYKRSSKRS